jgi:hypothetical protein
VASETAADDGCPIDALAEFLLYQLPPLEAAGVAFEGWITAKGKDFVGCGADLGRRFIGAGAQGAAHGHQGQQYASECFHSFLQVWIQ